MPRSRGGSAAEWERRRRQQEREAERARKAAEAAQKAAEREARRQYLEVRAAEAERRTGELAGRVEQLGTVLTRGLSRSARIDPSTLRRRVTVPELDLGRLAVPIAPPDWSQFEPPSPSAVGRLFGGEARYQRRLDEARGAFERTQAAHAQEEAERQ